MLTGLLLDALLVIQASLFLVFLLSALVFDRSLWLGSLVFLLSALAAVSWPDYGMVAATVAMGGGYGITAWRWWRRDASKQGTRRG